MNELCILTKLGVEFFGPMLFVCGLMMFFSVKNRTGSWPRPSEVIYLYVSNNVRRHKHAGLLTYLFILSFILFLVCSSGYLYCKFAG